MTKLEKKFESSPITAKESLGNSRIRHVTQGKKVVLLLNEKITKRISEEKKRNPLSKKDEMKEKWTPIMQLSKYGV